MFYKIIRDWLYSFVLQNVVNQLVRELSALQFTLNPSILSMPLDQTRIQFNPRHQEFDRNISNLNCERILNLIIVFYLLPKLFPSETLMRNPLESTS